MTFNVPVGTELVSTDVVDSVATFDPNALYLENDLAKYQGGIYAMAEPTMINLEAFSTTAAYSKGAHVAYNGGSFSVERDASQKLYVPTDASASYDAPSFEELTTSNNQINLVSHVGTADTAGDYSSCILIDGNVMYMMKGSTNSVRAYDISDPENHVLLGSVTAGTYDFQSARAMQKKGNTLFVGGYHVTDNVGMLASINVTDPSNMSVTQVIYPSGMWGGNSGVLVGDYFYGTGQWSSSVSVVSISNPAAMSQVTSFTNALISNPIDIVAYSDTILVLVDYTNGSLITLDITNPSSPAILGSLVSASLAYAIRLQIKNDVAFVSCYNPSNTLVAVDLSDPSTPSIISSASNIGLTYPNKLLIYGDIAYVHTGGTANKIVPVDISNPSGMIVGLPSESIGHPASGMAMHGDMVVVCGAAGDEVSAFTTVASLGNDVGLYHFHTNVQAKYTEISVVRISDGVEMARGELYHADTDGNISRYTGTGCTSGCGTERIVWIGDGKVYIFTASYTHTNGLTAGTDLRDNFLSGYGFVYIRPSDDQLPFDTKQYTSVVKATSQTWAIKALSAFSGVALGRLRGDSVTVVFKDSGGTAISTVTARAINDSIDTNLEPEPTSDIIYAVVNGAPVFIGANGTIEITISGTETEVGQIFPTASIAVGLTNLEFSHDIKNFDRNKVSAISGYVDHIKGNRVIQHKGSFDIEMIDYDKMVLLNKKLTQELIAVDGSDTTGNEAADGQGIFASTKIICRVKQLRMKSTVKEGDMANTTPVAFEFEEIV